MDQVDNAVRQRVAEFKASAAADLYAVSDIVDFVSAEASVDALDVEVQVLNGLIHRLGITAETLGDTLTSYPRIYPILCSLLSINGTIELEDGRRIPGPHTPPKDIGAAVAVASTFIELGLDRLLSNVADIRRLLLVVQVASDAPKRRFRLEERIKERTKRVVRSAVDAANNQLGFSLELGPTSSLPLSARRIVDFVVLFNGKARIAVVTTFQTHSGGRQTRDMTSLYPSIQSTLALNGAQLVLVADGQGMRSISDRVLVQLFQSVPHTMSLGQAEAGALERAFVDVISAPVEQSVDARSLGSLIESKLDHDVIADAMSLPVPGPTARLALANYVSTRDHLSLELSSEGDSLTWKRAADVASFRALRSQFDGIAAIEGFADLLGASIDQSAISSRSDERALVSIADDPIFSAPFLVGAHAGWVNADVVREFARDALQGAPSSRVAVLVSSGTTPTSMLVTLRDVQPFLPVTVVVIDVGVCLAMAQSSDSPRDRLRSLLLEQTDLTKLSPFVVRGVAPSRVFFGREEEEATLISTLATNSVALLGGRRIGKTSLMRHSFGRLQAANLRPFFGDCQVVRTWADFGQMARRQWMVPLPENFGPQHLFELVEQLRNGSGRSVVILLDEIDQLLDWDTAHTENEVPEAFFRACRSISQQGLAQFVFSGERTIANRIWDASSPHWNFCRPLKLQQLTRDAAAELIVEPLEALGVRLDDREDLIAACWDSTDGHPELLQFIGDKIVERINSRDRTDIFASLDDVWAITGQFEYAEQYMETFWGQATDFERTVSILLLRGALSVQELTLELDRLGVHTDGRHVHDALRMLDLYGIAVQSEGGYKLRALWFASALSFYGGPNTAINRYIKNIQL